MSNKPAAAIQVGGDHYQSWKVQPYVLMLGFSGPAAHIAGYLLRTKGDDDLEKAMHWCSLAMEAGMEGKIVDFPKGMPDLYMTAKSWLYLNGIGSETSLYKVINNLSTGHYGLARSGIGAMIRERDEKEKQDD